MLPVVCFADGALGGGGFFGLWKHIQMQKHHKTTSADYKHHYNLESFASHDKITSFSTSSSLTKLSGKTPCLPPISPFHQPASAQSWTKSFLSIYLNLQMPGSDANTKSHNASLTLVMMFMMSPSLIVSSSSFCASYGKRTLHCSRPDSQSK